jgi:hypothetical protein
MRGAADLRRGLNTALLCSLLFTAASRSAAQESAQPVEPGESQLASAFRHEGENLSHDCQAKFSALFSCAAGVLTETPVHLAVGSLAPKNGFAIGPAFVFHYPTTQNWDLGWNADAVVAPGGSWRAGAYVTLVRTAVEEPIVVPINAAAPDVTIHPYPVVDFHVQTTSLQRVLFFGEGPDSRLEQRSSFGMTETVAGLRGVLPIVAAGRVNLSLIGIVNGRFVTLRDPHGAEEPPVTALFSNETAPGLASQPGFVQLAGGARIRPTFFDDRFRLNYSATIEEFAAPSDSSQSFHRWSADLDHEIPITKVSVPLPSDTRGPNECGGVAPGGRCPAPTRNQYGAIAFRLLASSAGSGQVPFYFQPTLGGSDIDANRALSGYEDYRFRGADLLLLQESIEHYLFSVVGAIAVAEQGTVGASGIDLGSLKRSFAAGITLRAGNLPVAQLTYAWSPEGHRFMATVSTTLVGGSSRPSLR